MPKIKTKKAMELSMNVIIIAIILLLFLIIYFFIFSDRIAIFTQSTQKMCDCDNLLEAGEQCGSHEIRMYLRVKDTGNCPEDTPRMGYCCISADS